MYIVANSHFTSRITIEALSQIKEFHEDNDVTKDTDSLALQTKPKKDVWQLLKKQSNWTNEELNWTLCLHEEPKYCREFIYQIFQLPCSVAYYEIFTTCTLFLSSLEKSTT